MRMKYNNIECVKEVCYNNMPYEYIVNMVSPAVSNSRIYVNYDKNNKGYYVTVLEEYKKEWLPACVQKFINNHTQEVLRENKENNIIWYIYK